MEEFKLENLSENIVTVKAFMLAKKSFMITQEEYDDVVKAMDNILAGLEFYKNRAEMSNVLSDDYEED